MGQANIEKLTKNLKHLIIALERAELESDVMQAKALKQKKAKKMDMLPSIRSASENRINQTVVHEDQELLDFEEKVAIVTPPQKY